MGTARLKQEEEDEKFNSKRRVRNLEGRNRALNGESFSQGLTSAKELNSKLLT